MTDKHWVRTVVYIFNLFIYANQFCLHFDPVIVSMIYSRTQILQKEVFFIDVIDNVPLEKLMHLKAIFFLRCTDENVQKVCN